MLSFIEFLREDEDRYLRTAVVHGKKIYQGAQGENHHSLMKKHNLPSDDVEHAFINHRGQRLDRSKAYDYAKENDLLSPYGHKATQYSKRATSEFLKKRDHFKE